MQEEPQAEREPDDLDRVVASLVRHGVEFMIVGGFAVIYHGHMRATKDLDIFIRRSKENAEKTIAALSAVGFSFPELTARIFTEGKGVLLGEEPMRVDIISELSGVRFEDAWQRRKQDYYGNETVAYIGLDDLIQNKRAARREQDLADVAQLENIRERERRGG